MTFLLAISRADVARYVNVLVIVYVVIIFIRILMSWLPRIPYNRWLMAFLDLFPCEEVVALGRVAAAALEDLPAPASCLRHPASGGARLFREQIVKIAAKLG